MKIENKMENDSFLFLPGGLKQFRILKNNISLNNYDVLIIGPGCEVIAMRMIDSEANAVINIVNDYESLIVTRLRAPKSPAVSVKMMDYHNTDFTNASFDLIYAQASISLTNRNKIVKEIKRILKPDGVLCAGEITALKKDNPVFVKDIFQSSGILPLQHESAKEYYIERKFSLLYEEDLSSSLKIFYENASLALKNNIQSLSDQEKSYFKKILNKITHESNAYLKLGADKYIGYKMLILKNDA